MKNSLNIRYTVNKPNSFLFIIGAMKCGTTSLFDILGQHPEISPSKIKEPGYFASDRPGESLSEYLGLWNWDSTIHKYALESSVSYTQFPFIKGVPERISRTRLGEYRFIYVMRNPIARIESQVRHGLFAGWGKSLDEGISNDLIEFSRYAMQMDEYQKYFSRSLILPIMLEEFKDNPDLVLERICEFLGIAKNYSFSDVAEPRNSGEFFDSPPLVRLLSQSRLGTMVVRKLLPYRLKNWLRKKLSRVGNTNTNQPDIGRWKLKDEEKEAIIKQLLPDLKRLEYEYVVDIHNYWQIPRDLLE